jgi:hypothetical protein
VWLKKECGPEKQAGSKELRLLANRIRLCMVLAGVCKRQEDVRDAIRIKNVHPMSFSTERVT